MTSPAVIPLRLPNVNLESYSFEVMQHSLDQAALLSLYTVPRPGSGSRNVSTSGFVTQATLGRFESVSAPPPPSPPLKVEYEVEQAIRSVLHGRHPLAPPRLRARQTAGESAGEFQCDCRFCPDDFDWTAGKTPPDQSLDRAKSQRFAVLNATFDFGKGDRAGGFGVGRTYPAHPGGNGPLLCGAAGRFSTGSGKLEGLAGVFAMNGRVVPGAGFEGTVLCRFFDPNGHIRTEREIEEPRGHPCEARSTFYEFRIARETGAGDACDGTGKAAMRSARIVCASDGYRGLRSKLVLGPVMGTVESAIEVAAAEPGAHHQYRFLDLAGASVGTLTASLDDAVAMELRIAGIPARRAFEFGGFGSIKSGTGVFEGVQGVLAECSAFCASPYALSLAHVLQIADTEGRFRVSR